MPEAIGNTSPLLYLHQLVHVRIMLKADSSPDAPAWTDARINEAWKLM